MKKIETLSQLINKPIKDHHVPAIEDPVISWCDRYLIEIDESEIAVSGNYIAWVETHYQSTDGGLEGNFYVKALKNGKPFIEWNVECYNPVFGCIVFLLHWFNDKLVFIYKEKHEHYVVVIGEEGLIKKVRVSHEIAILENNLAFRNWDNENEVFLLNLPFLEIIDNMEYKVALQKGIETSEQVHQN